MTLFLREATAIDVRIGPFVDVGDGFTPETGVTTGASDQAEVLKANGALTVAMVGASALISLHNASGWGAGTPVIIDADDVNKALKIKVKGLAGRNIRWVAVVEAVEVIYSD